MLILSIALLAACGKHIESVQLQGYSMRPNFDDGQIFLIEKVALDKLQHGDLVLVGIGEKQWIKRLVGLPNETISIHDGSVFIDGVLLDEPYEVIPPTYTMQEIKLDNNSYFVLGDNGPNSADSRVWGAISGDSIIGKATLS